MKSITNVLDPAITSYAIVDSGSDTYLVVSKSAKGYIRMTAYVFWDGELVVDPISSWKLIGTNRKRALDLVCYCFSHKLLNVYELRDGVVKYSEFIDKVLDDSRIQSVYRTWTLGK